MRVGIVIPAFNAAPYVGEAIRSVLAQTAADWRLVVVDDGSTDGTAERVLGFGDRRIRLLRQANAGVSAARNRGMAAVEADAVLFLDADDWLAPRSLDRLSAALLAAPQAVASTGPARFVADGGAGRRRSALRPRPGDMLAGLLVRNRFANGGHVLIRAAALRAAGAFRTDLSFGEDWEFWVRLALLGRFAVVRGRSPLLLVRQRPDGAFVRQASDPEASRRCLAAIFGNPALAGRVPAVRRRVLRRRAEAEQDWVVGRALLQRDDAAAREWLRRSLLAAPSLRRLCLLAGLSAAASKRRLWYRVRRTW